MCACDCVCRVCLCMCIYVSVYVCCVCLCLCGACLCVCVLPHVCSGVCYAGVQCMCTFRRPYGNTMYIQWSNPMGIQCMHKGPILWGQNVCTKNQSMGTQCMHKEPILWDKMCTCTKDQSYETVHVATHTCGHVQSLKRGSYLMYEMPFIRELNMQTCTESSCKHNGCMHNTEEKHRVQKAWTSAFKLNRMHLYVTMFM